ncbi:UNVERIFIED_CONTAM: hypothetical protein FKN15_009256 [Acipenser sinensis]
MNTRCPPKRVPSAACFFTLCRLTVQPPQSYSVGGQRSSGQLTGKPAGARPDYRGRWCAAVDKLQIRFISSVQTGEEIVLSAKARIRAVIINNSHGPQRLDESPPLAAREKTMKLCWEKTDVLFTPSIDEVTGCLHSIVDSVVLSVQHFPRIEHQLFQAVDKLQIRFISSVQTGEEIVLSAKARIRAVIINNSHGPQRYCSVYQPSLPLLCAEAESRMEEFISKEPNLCNYTWEIERFQGLPASARSHGAAAAGLLPDKAGDLLSALLSRGAEWMVQRTHQLASIFISRVTSSSEKLNRSICQQYEDIVSRITTISGSTSALVELQG